MFSGSCASRLVPTVCGGSLGSSIGGSQISERAFSWLSNAITMTGLKSECRVGLSRWLSSLNAI